jgi:hypothetical protein
MEWHNLTNLKDYFSEREILFYCDMFIDDKQSKSFLMTLWNPNKEEDDFDDWCDDHATKLLQDFVWFTNEWYTILGYVDNWLDEKVKTKITKEMFKDTDRILKKRKEFEAGVKAMLETPESYIPF